MHEVDILSNFSYSSPSIVEMIEVFRDEKHIYLVTEYCQGGELFTMVQTRGTLTESEARQITKQLVEAVAYLHRRGVCHRDLKLENVLL
jgi:serine/threonine protein kinase